MRMFRYQSLGVIVVDFWLPWWLRTHDNSKTMLKWCIWIRPLIWDITWLYMLRTYYETYFVLKSAYWLLWKHPIIMDTHSNDFLTLLINQACPETPILRYYTCKSHKNWPIYDLKHFCRPSWMPSWISPNAQRCQPGIVKILKVHNFQYPNQS